MSLTFQLRRSHCAIQFLDTFVAFVYQIVHLHSQTPLFVFQRFLNITSSFAWSFELWQLEPVFGSNCLKPPTGVVLIEVAEDTPIDCVTSDATLCESIILRSDLEFYRQVFYHQAQLFYEV